MVENSNTTEVSQIESLLEKIGKLSDAVLHKKTNEKIHDILFDIAEQVKLNTPKIKIFLIFSFQDQTRREMLKFLDVILHSPKENEKEIQWVKRIMIKNRQNIKSVLIDTQLINAMNTSEKFLISLSKYVEKQKLHNEVIKEQETIIELKNNLIMDLERKLLAFTMKKG
ncbi:hypothetical protein HON22_01905 [Candidatus Peregrinibacteria bacterium]|jgi:hypothetical protein|nr:hypothetical protein [Candidatus Peregrinibacteria bacterium]